jgi:nucleoside-diphosphate-sugar epimerase
MAYYLIAGAAGYVGSRLARRLLDQGHRVRGIVRDPDTPTVEALARQGMSVWTGDLTQASSLVGAADGVEVAYNLSAPPLLDHEQVYALLVRGNQNLLAACSRNRSLRAYIFAGNVSPYGDRGAALLDEDAAPKPSYPLGEATVAAEQRLLEAARRHAFPAIILRMGTIYGPGRDPVENVRNGAAMLIGDGENYLAQIHIDDLLDVLTLLPEHGQPGAIYNVADDSPIRAAEYFGDLRGRLGMLPPRVYSAAGALYAGLDPNIVGLASSSARISNARLKHDLGFAPRYPSYTTWLDEQLGVEREVIA